jgi:general stress protein 26
VTRDELLQFLRAQPWAVEASVSGRGEPQAAVIGVAVTDRLELVFDTLATSRKAANLRANPRVALVLGWDEGQTAQIEGVADEPVGVELQAAKDAYLRRFPDGLERAALPDITYFRIVPSWIRYSDFRTTPPTIVVFEGNDLPRTMGATATPRSFDRVTANLPARDLVETETFYARLGFRKTFGDEGWLVLRRGALELEFFPHPALVPESSWFSACVRVDDVDSLVDAWRAASLPSAGIPRLVPPSNADSGLREAALVDCNGSLLRILGARK